ncbi:putative cell division protein FtsH-like protein [Campylobacter hyointestinalis]|uniref:ATP-dependent zinc metalloprotease FtsH n=1 Tax=Campylobacter hyointestinalis subsp. hyointestinalis TaxID=91352 RepID=A0A2S5J3K8_CAMHY|nr:ATP-dependent zinc metalloprotease FtsH [Campylobacter hyointestinalis]ANE32968.1 integral membrane ATP-dependent zinc metallopeptidase [Campylobacter hyointestinalis subsp. hyointestinalis LMG 9260]KEA43969.1 cell division protein FtsH [Campylobacter hyointestinalis subsp. hyointestinalis]MDL2347372.1 ATP-dependent zinc metalloprotease FtsH [Campylobacter hyointestinalis]MDL2349167.1 ATP-dependent zinc metalloprotease FtsH [Campylobacter hyointestinalis]MDL2350862.1 ATP-dependent zinc meta
MENNDNKNGQNNNNNGNFFNKNPIIVFAAFAIIIVLVFRSFTPEGMNEFGGTTNSKAVSYSELKQLIKSKQISNVSIGQTTIRAEGGGTTYIVKKVNNDQTLVPLLESEGVSYGAYSETNWFSDMLFSWVIPVFIFFGIWMFLASRMQKNMGGGILGMGSSKKLVNSERPKVKFNDVAGVEEAKEEVKEIVDFLKNPDRYISLGAKIPKGVLLVGPPGTGKTLLAKAVAGEADVPFFSVSGSSFIEMFVGVGASRVRDLFENAKKEAPAIVFIDEIDAIGKSRAAGAMMGGNDEREQTLNQLLAEMDGFDSDKSPVIVLAATNRPEVLDAALLRPGRFDRQVLVDKPDFKGRVDILKVHSKEVKLAKNVNMDDIGRLTAGLAGADLANIINEAALLAGRASKKFIEQQDLVEAVERAIAGLEKKSRRINPKEKKIVTYHECGHALIAETTKGADKVTKVSVIPRGIAALGYTLNAPEENKFLMQKHELIAKVDVLLGGRAAEHVFIKEISTGASNDLERATDIIKAMVSMYGMTDVAGLMVLEKQRNVFLNGGQTLKDYSDDMAHKLDEYVKGFLEERFKAVVATLELYKGAIEKMVEALYEEETIEGSKVREIIKDYELENNIPTRLVNNEDANIDIQEAKEKE